jgi:pimeloyl-ACP methyl ester carboxylesterase
MKFELVEIVTKDQLVHQGLFYAPVKKSDTALLWVHGLTGRFYSDPKTFSRISQACEEMGYGFASFNTRGHDFVTSIKKLDPTNPRGYTKITGGASVENFADCVLDIDAAVSFLEKAGYTKIILIGHSTGANKVCYYAGTQKDPRVAGVVMSGPMSDRYSANTEEEYGKNKVLVEQKIAEGKGEELMSGLDFLPLTPNRWMSLLGEGSLEDVFNYRDPTGALATFEQITIPALVLFGQLDEYADRPVSEIQAAFDAHAKAAQYKSVIIEGADHGFTGKEEQMLRAITDWMSQV